MLGACEPYSADMATKITKWKNKGILNPYKGN